MANRVEGNLNKDMGEDYLVAADLTLYANPLRVLNRKKKPGEAGKDEKKDEKKGSYGEGNEVIAADLTKYGSPLDDRKN